MIHPPKYPNRMHLFIQPSFSRGVARILDLFGTLNKYNTSDSAEQADSDALYSDWLAVGDDIQSGIEEYAKSVHDKYPEFSLHITLRPPGDSLKVKYLELLLQSAIEANSKPLDAKDLESLTEALDEYLKQE